MHFQKYSIIVQITHKWRLSISEEILLFWHLCFSRRVTSCNIKTIHGTKVQQIFYSDMQNISTVAYIHLGCRSVSWELKLKRWLIQHDSLWAGIPSHTAFSWWSWESHDAPWQLSQRGATVHHGKCNPARISSPWGRMGAWKTRPTNPMRHCGCLTDGDERHTDMKYFI